MRLLGHPVHPMLIIFPAGMFIMAVIFDILRLIFGGTALATASYYMIAAGIVGGLIAAFFGFLDWVQLPGDSRARRLGAWHGVGNFVIVVLFALSFVLRITPAGHVPNLYGLLPSFAGVLLLLVTAWLGGELVYRLGSQVDEGANPNAPSSLSGQPASASDKARDKARQPAD